MKGHDSFAILPLCRATHLESAISYSEPPGRTPQVTVFIGERRLYGDFRRLAVDFLEPATHG
jgi:hypothetical protein